MVTPADQPTPSNSDRALAILLHASDTLAAPGSWTKGQRRPVHRRPPLLPDQ